VAETGTRTDPVLAFRFEVTLDGLPAGGFSECSGLSVETEVQDYAEGGLNTHLHKRPGRTRQTNLTLRRGIVDRRLWDWYLDLLEGRVERRNGSVIVRDPSGGEVEIEWQFRRAFPCKWQGPDLSAAQSAVAVEMLELCHEGLERRT
jgi:phage tail-like protein